MYSFLASAITAAANYYGQQAANQTNQHMSADQMAWQERMSNTAHQREIDDLRKAGLNPILSGTGGPGASTPTGSLARVENALGPAVSSGFSTYKALKEIELVKAQAEKEKNSALKLLAEANLIPLQGPLLQGQAFSAFAQGRKLNEETTNQSFIRGLIKSQDLSEQSKKRLTDENINVVLEELKSLRNQGEISETKYGQVLSYIKRGVETIGPVIPWFQRGGDRSYSTNIFNSR